MMQQRSSISLYNLLRKYPFHHSPKPTSSFLSKTLTTLPTNTFPHSSRSRLSSKPTSNPTRFNKPTCSIFYMRSFSGDPEKEFDKNKIVDEINLKFAEAREEIEAAMESKETVYFNEEAECARAAVKEVLDLFQGLMGKLQDKEREALMRSMGLKIEQLKAELQQLEE